MTKEALNRVQDLLSEYDGILQHKCDVFARGMAEWIGVSDAKAEEYKKEYIKVKEKKDLIRAARIDIDLVLCAKQQSKSEE